jgi:hypothetical protein
MSIVSILEFIILFVVMIVYMIIKPKRPDLGGFDYWAQFDKLVRIIRVYKYELSGYR